MPLETSITRDGQLLQLPWSDFHVAAMALAATLELPPAERKLWDQPEAVEDYLQQSGYPDEPLEITMMMCFNLCNYGALSLTPLNSGGVTLASPHKFLSQMDGEVFELLPGDVLWARRIGP